MQQQRIPEERRGSRLSEDEIDNTVVSFLLDKPSWPWSLRRSRANSAIDRTRKTP